MNEKSKLSNSTSQKDLSKTSKTINYNSVEELLQDLYENSNRSYKHTVVYRPSYPRKLNAQNNQNKNKSIQNSPLKNKNFSNSDFLYCDNFSNNSQTDCIFDELRKRLPELASKSNRSKHFSLQPKSHICNGHFYDSDESPSSDNLHSGHRDRLRNRIRKQNIEDMNAHEVLECMLYTIVDRKDTNTLAHQLLNHFGSLTKICNATTYELTKFKDISAKGATFLQMFPYLARYFLYAKAQLDDEFIDVSILVKYAQHMLSYGLDEGFLVLFFDANNRQIAHTIIRESQLLSISIRDIVTRTLELQAYSVFVAHSHPTEISKPSADDDNFTEHLYTVLSAINVYLIDHVVITQENFYSYQVEGFFSRKKHNTKPKSQPKTVKNNPNSNTFKVNNTKFKRELTLYGK